jgi:modification methylase
MYETFTELNRLYVSDAIVFTKSLPDNFIDLTITSPPYNKCNNKNMLSLNKKKYIYYDVCEDFMPENDYQNQQIEVLNLIYEKTKDGGSLFYNHRVRYKNKKAIFPHEWIIKTKWNVYQEIIWDKMLVLNVDNKRFWHVDERIFWLCKGVPKDLDYQSASLRTVWRIKENHEKDLIEIHPAPFRRIIPRTIIKAILGNEHGIVYDPYCGIGIALLEAKNLGKSYIGCDISKKYIDTANKIMKDGIRSVLEDDTEQPKLFSEW